MGESEHSDGLDPYLFIRNHLKVYLRIYLIQIKVQCNQVQIPTGNVIHLNVTVSDFLEAQNLW